MEPIAALRDILVGAVLCGAIGFEREWRNKPAGILIHLLVGVGTIVMTLISVHGFQSGDPARLVAQAVTGIGFIGAGVIFQRGNLVHGLTTAASLWVTLAVGIAVGVGWHAAAAVTSLFTVAVLVVGPPLLARLPGRTTPKLTFEIDVGAGDLPRLVATLDELGATLTRVGDVEPPAREVARMTAHRRWRCLDDTLEATRRLRQAGARRVSWNVRGEDDW